MIEPLFESIKNPDPEDPKRLYRFIYWRRPGLWIFMGILVVLEILGLWLRIGMQDHSVVTTFCILYLPACLVVLFFQFKRALKIQAARIEEVSSGDTEDKPNVYRFYEDHFTYETKASSFNISYAKVKKTLLHGDFIILVTDSKVFYGVDRNFFTIGDPQGLLRFLASKGIK